MKLIFIYGSPAVGKLTVANELAKMTGFKVFHNHLTINCVTPVFDFGRPSFGRLVGSFRLQLIAETAREEVDLIHTYVYAKPDDDAYVEKVMRAVEHNGGEFCPVLLICGLDELERRVTNESRRLVGKVETPEMLRSLHENYELTGTISGPESLIIDNTSLPPSETVKGIARHFQLPIMPA